MCYSPFRFCVSEQQFMVSNIVALNCLKSCLHFLFFSVHLKKNDLVFNIQSDIRVSDHYLTLFDSNLICAEISLFVCPCLFTVHLNQLLHFQSLSLCFSVTLMKVETMIFCKDSEILQANCNTASLCLNIVTMHYQQAQRKCTC